MYLCNNMKAKSLKLESLEYFSTLTPPSVSEARIVNILIKNNISFLREVSFTGWVTKNGGHYRYDFLLLKNMVLIEYDGKDFHSSKEQKKIDRLKSKFCKDNGLTLIRLDKKAWGILESVILQCCQL